MAIGLLLVEDEEAIQEKLLHNVRWADYGFDPVLSARNGVEALALLESHPEVRIMVTDVQMPKLNGIELIKEIKQRKLPMKIIVISGFAEFEYAQESIKLNVSDYLLKPFASRRLLEVVLRLQSEVRDEAAKEDEWNDLRKQLRENRLELEEKLFMDLLGGNITANNIAARLEFLGLNALLGRPFQVVVLEIPEANLERTDEEKKYLLNLQFYQSVRRIVEKEGNRHICINYRRNQVTLIVFDPPADLPARLEEILVQLRLTLNHSLSCGVGHLYHELSDLSVSYQEASTALKYRYLYGLNQVFSINDLNLNTPSYHKIFYQLHCHPIFNDLKIGAAGALEEDLRKIITEMRELQLSPELSRIAASNLILLTCTTLNELGYNAAEVIGADFSILTEVNSAESLEALEKLLISFFTEVNGFIRQKRTSYNDQLIEEIRWYIDSNYASDITLSGMANHYKISPGYLSALFSERTGINFVDYLSERRIKKAQELLKHTNMKIYEISNAVGYKDSFYFSNCFKKITGHSPSEYRENFLKGMNGDG